MSQCHERFYKELKVAVLIRNVTIEDIAAIQELLRERRKKDE